MRDDGVTHALAFVTSPYGSYSSCRQYLDDIETARAHESSGAPVIDKIRHYHDHPGHIDAARARRPGGAGHCWPAGLRRDSCSPRTRSRSRWRPPPDPGGGTDRYRAQLHEVGRAGRRARPRRTSPGTWCGRAGPGRPACRGWSRTSTTTCARLHADGVTGVVVSPIGFISDHLEVAWDLDNEAPSHGGRTRSGLRPRRHARYRMQAFVAMIRDLTRERLAGAPRQALGNVPTWDRCPADCCPAPVRPSAASLRP